jgi:hypothetical protein
VPLLKGFAESIIDNPRWKIVKEELALVGANRRIAWRDSERRCEAHHAAQQHPAAMTRNL